MQLGAGTSLFCLSQCAIPFCTLSACRMLENACRHIQAQPETIPIGGVYYPYNQWDNTIERNGICYEVDWVGQ